MGICCIKECENEIEKGGMCPKHWARLKQYGNPMLVKVVQLHGVSDEDRFWARVEKSESCWLWMGGKNRTGYGMLRINNKTWLSHRYSWVIHYGQIPDNMSILHKCDNPSCVRPSHLFIGNQWE